MINDKEFEKDFAALLKKHNFEHNVFIGIHRYPEGDQGTIIMGSRPEYEYLIQVMNHAARMLGRPTVRESISVVDTGEVYDITNAAQA